MRITLVFLLSGIFLCVERGDGMNLLRYEQAVVINLNLDENMATVYSENLVWI